MGLASGLPADVSAPVDLSTAKLVTSVTDSALTPPGRLGR